MIFVFSLLIIDEDTRVVREQEIKEVVDKFTYIVLAPARYLVFPSPGHGSRNAVQTK